MNKVLEAKTDNVTMNYLPNSLIEKYRLGNKIDCIKNVHFPNSLEDVKRGYRYLKYEELLEFVTTLEMNKREFKKSGLKAKEIDDFSKTLQKNKNLYRFVAEANEVIPFSKIAEALELKTEKECEKMYNELCKIASSKKDVNDEVEKFMNKYSL